MRHSGGQAICGYLKVAAKTEDERTHMRRLLADKHHDTQLATQNTKTSTSAILVYASRHVLHSNALHSKQCAQQSKSSHSSTTPHPSTILSQQAVAFVDLRRLHDCTGQGQPNATAYLEGRIYHTAA